MISKSLLSISVATIPNLTPSARGQIRPKRPRALARAAGHSGAFVTTAPLEPVSYRFYEPDGRPTDPTSGHH